MRLGRFAVSLPYPRFRAEHARAQIHFPIFLPLRLLLFETALLAFLRRQNLYARLILTSSRKGGDDPSGDMT
jgi:hypothetical protein